MVLNLCFEISTNTVTIIVAGLMIIILFSALTSIRISYAQISPITEKTSFLTRDMQTELFLRHGTFNTEAITDARSYPQPPKIFDVKFTLIDIKNGSININPKINELSPSVRATLAGPTKPEKPVYIISTREGSRPYYDLFENTLDLYRSPTSCPPEVAILIHGWDNDLISSLKDFDRASMSIDFNEYKNPIIGIVWKSDHPERSTIVEAEEDWKSAKEIATDAGHGLAKFLRDFKGHCNDTTLRIVAHSLGTRVVVSALEDLDSDDMWKNSPYEIGSIHFLGAAIDDNILDTHKFSDFVQNYVTDFYNLYNPSDAILGGIPYKLEEGAALGLEGSKAKLKPTNYEDVNVAREIVANDDANGDRICDLGKLCPLGIGENHLGYWGFVNEGKHWIDDGVMNIVVDKWMELMPAKIPEYIPPREIIPKGPIP
jgi:hypothetical protein